MPSRRCPSCYQPLQPLFFGRVALDRCFRCTGTWFDGGELARVVGPLGAPAMTREQPASRCPACTGLLWFARAGACELLACVDCGGGWVTDTQLERAASGLLGRTGQLAMQFVCVSCGDRYALAQGVRSGAGLACARCRAEEEGARSEEEAGWRAVLERVVGRLMGG